MKGIRLLRNIKQPPEPCPPFHAYHPPFAYHVLPEDDDEGEDLEEDSGGDSWQPFILPLLTMSSPKTMMNGKILKRTEGGDSWQPFILPLLTMSSPKTMINGKISKRTVEETAGSLLSSLCLPCPPRRR
jgi:hypothetical protein